MFKNILPKQQEVLFDSVPTTTLQTYFSSVFRHRAKWDSGAYFRKKKWTGYKQSKKVSFITKSCSLDFHRDILN